MEQHTHQIASMSDQLQKTLKSTAEKIHETMDNLLPAEQEGRVGENRLARAMRYSVLAPGKRLRPFLVVSSANLFGVSEKCALQAAAAIEFVHAYSLIHDDLPAMDDDDFRRGKPSLHKEFDEATAILAGDSLLTFAFEVLAHESTHNDSNVRSQLVLELAKASGVNGMVGGQMIDLISEERDLTIDQITRLQRMKTGALFAVSCEMGAILGKAPMPLRNALRGYARDIGLAFQITDDILDAAAANDESSDRENKSEEKGTYITSMGVDGAKRQARMLCQQATAYLDVFDAKKTNLLKELANFVVNRQH